MEIIVKKNKHICDWHNNVDQDDDDVQLYIDLNFF